MPDIEQAESDGAASTVNSDGGLGAKAEDSQDKDQQFLMEMRGWMVAVATLFVGIAFQAVMQPPGWMPKGNWLAVYRNSYKKHHEVTTGASSSSHADRPAMLSPSPSPPPAITASHARMAYFYVFTNATTFGIALSLVVSLVLTKNPPPKYTMRYVQVCVAALAMTVVITFVMGTSDVPSIQYWVGAYTAAYAIITIAFVRSDLTAKYASFIKYTCERAFHTKRKNSSTHVLKDDLNI